MQKELFGKYPVYYEQNEVGSLSVTRDGLRAYFHCACKVHSEEVLRLFLVSEEKTSALGVMIPNGEYLQFTKHFTKHDLHIRDILSIDSCVLATEIASIAATPSKAVPAPIPASTVTLPTAPIVSSPVVVASETPAAVTTEAPVVMAEMPAPVVSPPVHTSPLKEEAPAAQKNVWNTTNTQVTPIEEMLSAPRTFIPPIAVSTEPIKAPAAPLTPPTSDWEFVDTWGKVEKDGTEHFTLHPPEDTPPAFAVELSQIENINPYPEAVHNIETATWSSMDKEDAPKQPNWNADENIARFFADPLLKTISSTIQGGLVQQQGTHIKIAAPFESGAPFPLMPIFCKGEPMEINGKSYLVFTLQNGEIL